MCADAVKQISVHKATGNKQEYTFLYVNLKVV